MSSQGYSKAIVVGGGLAGLCAAHMVIERGGRVLMIDKNSFMGGNSTKATSGINGAPTKFQQRQGIQDSVDIFLDDTIKGGKMKEVTAVQKTLVYNSAAGVEWLGERFGLDLSIIGRLGGHTHPRTHRGKERFPGMTITYALMEKLEEIAKNQPALAQIVTEAKVNKLLTAPDGSVIGVNYEKNGQQFQEYGAVVIASGGYGNDYGEDGLLKQVRPDLLPFPTTNGDHCTGDGIKMATAIGANAVDMNQVQVHPTGLVHPNEPNAKVKFLAAEALRGAGGIMLDRDGNRFCNELGTRDYVSGEMMRLNKAPYRLVLNSKSSKEIEWHCKHYMGRGLMKRYEGISELAKDMGITEKAIKDSFNRYNDVANKKNDPYGKKFFDGAPYVPNDEFYVAIIVPVVHYCMGGIQIDNEAQVISKTNKPIKGLFACGEVTGGVHGNNRLGGSSLMDCVVYGRVAGESAARFLLQSAIGGADHLKRVGAIARQFGAADNAFTASINHGGVQMNIEIKIAGSDAAGPVSVSAPAAAPAAAPAPAAAAAPAAPKALPVYTLDDVAKHNKESDCWVVVNGQVLDVTNFLPKHPGGKQAILLFAGKDATAEFNMLHKPDVVQKYAPDSIIGTIAGGSSASH